MKNGLRQHIVQLVDLTERYLACLDQAPFPDPTRPESEFRAMQDALRAERERAKEKIEKAVEERRRLFDFALQNNLHKHQDEVLSTGKDVHRDPQWSERQRMIIEYELAFLGVNLLREEEFMPMVLRYLTDAHWKSQVVFDVGTVSPSNAGFYYHLLDDMTELENARWGYSRDDKYPGETDLGEHIWCAPSTFEELRDETAKFLNDKERILEIGFLHQRIYDLIMDIDSSTEYHGVDICIPAVSIARKKGITAFNANAWYAIPYPDNYFDGIVTSTLQASGLYRNPEMERVLKDPDAILNFDLQ